MMMMMHSHLTIDHHDPSPTRHATGSAVGVPHHDSDGPRARLIWSAAPMLPPVVTVTVCAPKECGRAATVHKRAGMIHAWYWMVCVHQPYWRRVIEWVMLQHRSRACFFLNFGTIAQNLFVSSPTGIQRLRWEPTRHNTSDVKHLLRPNTWHLRLHTLPRF